MKVLNPFKHIVSLGIFATVFMLWITPHLALADSKNCAANAVNLVSQAEFKSVISGPRIGTFSVAISGETRTVKAQIDKLLETNNWISGDTNELYNPSRSKLHKGICYLGHFSAVCGAVNGSTGINTTEAYRAVIETQPIGNCSAASPTQNLPNPSQQSNPSPPGIVENIINGIEQLLHIGNQGQTNPSSCPVSNYACNKNCGSGQVCQLVPQKPPTGCYPYWLATCVAIPGLENAIDLNYPKGCTSDIVETCRQNGFRCGDGMCLNNTGPYTLAGCFPDVIQSCQQMGPGYLCRPDNVKGKCVSASTQTTPSQSTNPGTTEGIVPVYPEAKLVPKIGRPVANGWNRLYVIGGVQVNEVLQYYQDWMGKTGRIARILLPLSTRDVTADNYDHCSSIDVALGSGGKVGQEMISIKISAVTPHNDCTFILDNAQPGITGGDQQAVGYSFTTHFTPGFSLTPNAYTVGGNNTVIDIYYTSKQERVGSNNPVPSTVNTAPNQKLLPVPSNPSGPAIDNFYELNRRVSDFRAYLGYLGHAVLSTITFGLWK